MDAFFANFDARSHDEALLHKSRRLQCFALAFCAVGVSYPSKLCYKTSKWHAYNDALKQWGSLTKWLDAGMGWEAKPSGKRGRQKVYSDAAI